MKPYQLDLGPITFFDGTDYDFLSNFHPASFSWMGLPYSTSEHFFQAAKATGLSAAEVIRCAFDPGEAKAAGNRCMLRIDWEQVKDDVMRLALRLKFTSHQHLAVSLMDTYPRMLIEGNTWGDTYWGVDNIEGGRNMLGLLLMELRTQLIGERNAKRIADML